MSGWLELFRLVRDIGVDVVLPLIRTIHAEGWDVPASNRKDAEQKLRDALNARAAGRAAYDAGKQAKPLVYEPQPGDTWESVALKFGVDVDKLLRFNATPSTPRLPLPADQLTWGGWAGAIKIPPRD